MSAKKRTKGKKKKNQEIEERKPQIKIGYGNPSELIAHQLIDRLISLTVSQSFKNRVYSNEVFGTYCTRYCYEMVVPLVELYTVRHDRDDLYDNEENWRTVPEVERVTFDRDAHTFVHVENTHNKSEFNEIKEKEVSKIQTIISSKRNSLKLIKKKKEYISTRNVAELPDKESTHSHASKDSITHNQSSNVKGNKSEIESGNKENNDKIKKQKVIELPSYDIKGISITKENEEVLKLREEREQLLLQKREKELKEQKKKEELKQKKNQSMFLNPMNKQSNFIPVKLDLNKYTFDPDGKIVPYRIIPQSNFINEFSEIVSEDKFVKEVSPITEEQHDSLLSTRRLKDNEIITYNNDLSDNRTTTTKKRTLQKFTKVPTLNRIDKNSYCQPAGDNFSIITPETGVIVKYDQEKTKIGNMSFLKKYNKFSSLDFTNVLNETMSKNKQSANNSMMDINDISKNMSDSSMNMSNASMSRLFAVSQKLRDIKMNSLNSVSHKYSSLNNSMSIGKIILSKNKSSVDLLETFDEQLPEIGSKSNTNKTLKNLFKDFFTRKYYHNKIKEAKANTERQKKLKRNKSLESINRFTVKIAQNLNFGITPKNEIKEERVPYLKLPIKPNPFHMIRQNGILVKPLRSFRVNYQMK